MCMGLFLHFPYISLGLEETAIYSGLEGLLFLWVIPVQLWESNSFGAKAVFIEFFQYGFCPMFWFSGHKSCGILVR